MLRWTNTAGPEYTRSSCGRPTVWLGPKEDGGKSASTSVFRRTRHPQPRAFYETFGSREVTLRSSMRSGRGGVAEGTGEDETKKRNQRRSSSLAARTSGNTESRRPAPGGSRIDGSHHPFGNCSRKYPDRKRGVILQAMVKAKLEPEQRASLTAFADGVTCGARFTRPRDRIDQCDPAVKPPHRTDNRIRTGTSRRQPLKTQTPPYSVRCAGRIEYEPWVTE